MAHRLRAALSLVVLASCSSTSSNSAGPTPGSDSGSIAESGSVDSAAADASAGVDAEATYEKAVLASNWTAIPKAPSAPAGAKMDDIYFPSAMVGYAVSGPGSTIYKTVDGGTTWTSSFVHAGTYFRSLDFIDDDTGFASNLGAGLSPSISDTNVLYGTKDGGATWTPVTAIQGPMPSGICNQTHLDATHLYAVGRVEGPAFFMSSSDGGATWTSKSLASQLSMLIDVRFTSVNDGLLIGAGPGNLTTGTPPFHCTILRTSDGGSSWQTAFTSKTDDSLCWKMSFPTSQIGYASVQDAGGSGPPTFVKTTDGGQTWTEKPLPTNPTGAYAGIGMGFITENVGWVSSDADSTGKTQPTYRTEDGGETWKVDPSLKSPINRFRFVDPTTAFAIGGTIWKLSVTWTGGDF